MIDNDDGNDDNDDNDDSDYNDNDNDDTSISYIIKENIVIIIISIHS